MEATEIKHFIEAALLATDQPLSVDHLQRLFDGRSAPEKTEIRLAIKALIDEYEPRGITVIEVASGFRIQVKVTMADRLHKLWEERPPRYSRALFETLALVAYRQPITRGEIEEVRGVAVSSNIVRTLMERDWIRVVGHRDVPGRPAMFGTTKTFLDYFSLKKLDDLPPLADLSDWESLRVQLNLPEVEETSEIASADIAEFSTMIPESAVDGPQAIESDDEDENDLPDLETEDTPNEELVVSEWPDPSDAAGVATLNTDSTDDDKDASAGGA